MPANKIAVNIACSCLSFLFLVNLWILNLPLASFPAWPSGFRVSHWTWTASCHSRCGYVEFAARKTGETSCTHFVRGILSFVRGDLGMSPVERLRPIEAVWGARADTDKLITSLVHRFALPRGSKLASPEAAGLPSETASSRWSGLAGTLFFCFTAANTAPLSTVLNHVRQVRVMRGGAGARTTVLWPWNEILGKRRGLPLAIPKSCSSTQLPAPTTFHRPSPPHTQSL